MNGIVNITDSQGNNLSTIAQKVTDITYNANTLTTSIDNNTRLYDASANNFQVLNNFTLPSGEVFNSTSGFLDPSSNQTITGHWYFEGDLSANNLQILNSLTLPNGDVIDSTKDVLTADQDATITGTWTFGDMSANNINTTTLRFPDGTSFDTASAFIPSNIDCSNITVSNTTTTDLLIANNAEINAISCQTIDVDDFITSSTDTGYTAESFVFNNDTMCYKNPIVGNVVIGNYVRTNTAGIPFGDMGDTVRSINTTNRNISFDPSNNLVVQSPYLSLSGVIPNSNTFLFFDNISSSGLVGKGVRGTGVSNNQPFITAAPTSHTLTNQTSTLTPTTIVSKTGYISAVNNASNPKTATIVSNDTFTNGNFIDVALSIPPNTSLTTAPTTIVSQSGVSVNIQSRNSITQSANDGFLSNSLPLTTNTLAYGASSGTIQIAEFINGYDAGITISAIDAITRIVTVANGTFTVPSASFTVEGYIPSSSTVQLATIGNITTGNYITGSGFPSRTGQDCISSITGALVSVSSTLTPATVAANFNGYINSSNKIVVATATTTPTANFFLTSAALTPPTQFTSRTNNQLNITSTPAATSVTAFSAFPFNTNKLQYNGTPAFSVGSFITGNSIVEGSVISALDTTNKVITLSDNLTSYTDISGNVDGYVNGTSSIVLEPASPSTLIVGDYITGLGIGVNGIPVSTNSWITAIPTTNRQYTLQNNTNSTTPSFSYNGYLKIVSSVPYFYTTGNSIINGKFIEGTGIPQTSRLTYVSNNTLSMANSSALAYTSSSFTNITKSFIYNSNTIYYDTGTITVNSFVDDASIAVASSIATSNVTNKSFTTNLTQTPDSVATTKAGYISGTSTLVIYDTTGLTTSQWINPAQSTLVNPLISAINSSTGVVTIAGSGMTATTQTATTGYIKSASGLTATLITLGTFATNDFLTGASITNSTRVNAVVTSRQYTIESTSAISNSAVSTFVGWCPSSTILISNNSTISSSQFLESSLVNLQAVQIGTRSNNTYTTTTAGAYTTSSFVSGTGAIALISSSYYLMYDISNVGALSTNTFPVNSTYCPQGSGALLSATNFGSSAAILLTQGLTSTTASPTRANTAAAIYIIRSVTSTTATLVYKAATTRFTGVTTGDFFLNVASNAANGAAIISHLQQATLLGGVIQINRGSSNGVSVVGAPTYTATSSNSTTSNVTFNSPNAISAMVGRLITGGSSNPDGNYIVSVSFMISITCAYPITQTSGTTFNIYAGDTLSGIFTPQSFNFNAPTTFSSYNSIAYNKISPTTFDIYNSRTIQTTAGISASTYNPINYTYYRSIQSNNFISPINFNTIQNQTYSIYQQNITSQTFIPDNIFTLQQSTYDFYTPQTITYYRYDTIQLPSEPCTLVGDTTTQTLTNKTLTAPIINTPTITNATINTSFTLFGNSFFYQPWTAIVNHTGTYTTNPLIGVLDVQTTRPTPLSNSGLVIRYYYSVCGKNLYINYYFRQTGAGTAGTSNAYYYKIPSQFHGSLSPMLYSSSSLTTPLPGTRLGSAVLHAYGNTINSGSVYYSTLNGGTPSILLYREQVTWGVQSPANFGYNVAQETGFWFEAIIPLA
jgi:hypothetical protein